jgi:phosphoribosylpyrophosphate synthetase
MIKVTNNTYRLNLDLGFKPVEINNEISFTQFTFQGGEPHIRLYTEHKYNDAKLVITHRVNSPEALFMLQLAVDTARRIGFKEISLVIPYFPGARQDRVCNEGEPLTIKVYEENGEFILKDQATWEEVKNCAFEQVFSNGKLICHTSLARIRENVAKNF